MKIKRLCGIYFLCYSVFSLGYTQYMPYLASLGYTATQRGVMVSAYGIANIVFQLLFGYLSDRFRRIRQFFIVTILGYAVTATLFFAVDRKLFALHFCMIVLSGGLVNANFSITDNWLFSLGESERKYFSFIRAFGSLGWTVTSVLIAGILSLLGYRGFGVFILLGAVLLACIVQWNGDGSQQVRLAPQKVTLEDVRGLVGDWRYSVLVLGLLLLSCATSASSTVVMDKMFLLEATNAQIGLRWAICGGAEIPIYLMGSKLLDRFSPYPLLMVSAGMIVTQYLLYGLSPSVNGMIVISGIQMLTMPLQMLGSRALFYKYSPEKIKSTGLLMATATYQGLSILITPTLGGYITDRFHVNTTLFIATGVACAGAAIVVCLGMKQRRVIV